MSDQNAIINWLQTIIPAELWNKYSHLSFGEMAEIPELEDYRDELLEAENEWFGEDES